MVYMVAAYLVIWAVAFALILSMVYRQRRIDSELAALEEALREERH